MALGLEIAAHGVTAILGTWLGLLVVTRGRRPAGAWIFAFLCLLLVVWSIAIIIQRTGTQVVLHAPVNLAEDVAAFFIPAVTLHIALSVAFEGPRPPVAIALLGMAYLLSVTTALQAGLDPEHPIVVNGPSWSPFGIPGPLLGWAFIAARGLIFGAAVAYLVAALRVAGEDRARQQQVKAALATVMVGAFGGMLRILPENIGGPAWVGVSLVAVAMVLAAYAILAQHVFLAADVTVRAIRWSLFAGIGIVLYIALLLALDEAARAFLGVDVPIVTALGVVVTIALFDPVTERLRNARTASTREMEQSRLMRALGQDAIVAQAPERSVEPVLARLTRTFDMTGATVTDGDGAVRATVGALTDGDPLGLRLPLGGPDAPLGYAAFGAKRSGLAFTADEREALEATAAYLSATLRLAERHREQASALGELREEGSAVESRGSALSELLAGASMPAPGLRVYALGPLRAERDGEPVRRWGGEKAGSRQAEGLFAFLFDRGERGAAKDEILELVWPDVDLDRADVAFHRTMLGLRGMLRPNGRARDRDPPITFHNDRYRLDPSIIAWSDVAEFERLLAEAGGSEAQASTTALEAARALYRGDYLDDCPFYGDSFQVEERRAALRLRYVDLLIDLAERQARRGDRSAAAASLREAAAVTEEEEPRIEQAMARLAAASN